MSTRCAIVELTTTGARGIYCHHDGYLDGVGSVLNEHYQDPAKVSALIDLGDVSSIGPRVAPDSGESHSYNRPVADVCVAYIRDRGESRCVTRVGDSLDDVLAKIGHNGHVYVFAAAWSYNGVPLAEALRSAE